LLGSSVVHTLDPAEIGESFANRDGFRNVPRAEQHGHRSEEFFA
jgi:hypothetical protein